MKITIEKEVFKNYPKLRIAFIVAEDLKNHDNLKEAKLLLKETEKLVKLTFHKDNVKNHLLVSNWTLAQEALGKKAKHYQTSLERLLKTALSRKTNSTKDTLTTLINFLSIKHLVPVGVDDFFKIKKRIIFDVTKKGRKKGEPGELHYEDADEILSTKLDFWKNKRTVPGPFTAKALIHFDILPPINDKKIGLLIKETKSLLKDFCNAKTHFFILDKKKNSIEIQ